MIAHASGNLDSNRITLYTYDQKPEMSTQIALLSEEAWPRFMLHGNVRHWHLLFEMFPEYQLLLCDSKDILIAIGHTVPIQWDGSVPDLPGSIEAILLRAEAVYRNQKDPNTVSALAAIVSSGYRGLNLSRRIIQEMKLLAQQYHCSSLIAPVRPTLKWRYPLTSMERYVDWKRNDGSPYDPWIRVHWRLGAHQLCIAPNTLTVEGKIEDWEDWTDMTFPDSGLYIIPGGLQPLKVNVEQGTGRYEDPNCWMMYPIH